MSFLLVRAWFIGCLYGICVYANFIEFTRIESGDNKRCPGSPLWTGKAQSTVQSVFKCIQDPYCHAVQYNTENGQSTGQPYNPEVSHECREEPGLVIYGTVDGQCLPGYTWNVEARICYRLSEGQCVTWMEAREICRGENTDLLVLEDFRFRDFFTKLLMKVGLTKECHTYDGVWVGASDSEDEGNWRWVNGGQVDHSIFAPGEPTAHVPEEDCMYLLSEYNFKGIDAVGSRKLHFACGKVM